MPDALEILRNQNASAADRQQQEETAHRIDADVDEFGFGVIDEHQENLPRENLYGKVRNDREQQRQYHRGAEGFQHPEVFLRPVIIAGQRLHSHTDAEHQPHQQLVDGHDHAEGGHRQQTTVIEQHVVLDGPDDASGDVDRER
ncbi:hypothetical protein SDC9_176113 [bioreactor metagenome]|uniref:Uncharacterized protein n=1 Tax=bioreactor metagenome TaxID=1076179 RepID=A0A645GS65_9ZZZZ